MLHRCAMVTFLLMMTPLWAAQSKQQQRKGRSYPPELPEAAAETYKTVGDVKLNLYIFTPKDHSSSDQRAAVVFFFGGGWRSGSPGQFHEHCKYLASRGMVAVTADYRVSSRHGTKARECVADAKSAVRWIRANATRLGIDAKRVAAGGGSAGGHIAACTGVISDFDASKEDASVSSVPNAMVLFNPALVLAPVADELPFPEDRLKDLQERMGAEPARLSPYHHVKSGAPATIIFHGKADTTVPYRTAELFDIAMNKAGNRCQLIGFEGQPHGFFNHGRSDNRFYIDTVRAMDKFFVELGFLEGQPTIK
jgi:acetyl esterase